MEFNQAFKEQAIDPRVFLDQYFEGQRERRLQEMEAELKKMPFLQAPPLEGTHRVGTPFFPPVSDFKSTPPFFPPMDQRRGTPPIAPPRAERPFFDRMY